MFFQYCCIFLGQFKFKENSVLDRILQQSLAPIRYVDDGNFPTEAYPFNPNGSVAGIAALSSQDGRHLAMMPHPERCVLSWQWPWMPSEWQRDGIKSPWMCMFYNAYEWCTSAIDEN